MSDDKAILTEYLIHKVVREVYRGKSVDEAFEATGVDPAIGSAWLRNAGEFQYHKAFYILNHAIEGALAPDNRINIGRLTPGCFLTGLGGSKVLDKIDDAIVADVVEQGAAWIRRMRSDVGGWAIYPEASVRELYPNISRMDRGDVIEEATGGDIGDGGEIKMPGRWISVKRELVARVKELTVLWQVGRLGASRRMILGYTNGTENGRTPADVGIEGDKQAPVPMAILAANVCDSKDSVLPARIENTRAAWHAPAGLEFFVDFEIRSVSSR